MALFDHQSVSFWARKGQEARTKPKSNRLHDNVCLSFPKAQMPIIAADGGAPREAGREHQFGYDVRGFAEGPGLPVQAAPLVPLSNGLSSCITLRTIVPAMMGPCTMFSIPANINSPSTSTSQSSSLSGIRLNTGPGAEEFVQVITINT